MHTKQKHRKIIYDPAKCRPNQRDAESHETNMITGPRCSAKYGRSFAEEFLLYKLQTWPIYTGLRSQTTSAIITNGVLPTNLFLFISIVWLSVTARLGYGTASQLRSGFTYFLFYIFTFVCLPHYCIASPSLYNDLLS